MTTISRWVIPNYFTEENDKTDELIFDLTEHLQLILKNEVWNRKFDYGFSIGLKNTNPSEIKSAIVKVYPRFLYGYVNEKRIQEIIENVCGKIPTYFNVGSFKEWPYRVGCSIIEIEYYNRTKNIPSKKDLTDVYGPNYDIEFLNTYHQQLAVLQEAASFFLAGLHLTFPTQSFMIPNKSPLNDGFYHIRLGRKSYATKVVSNAFMHEILIETSEKSLIESNFKELAKVWHYNLWPLKRFLKAVESDQISIDNLLDLIYALEGLFDKSTSSDFIKTMCILSLCDTRKEAKLMKSLLDTAFRIRNEIVHGAYSFEPFDSVKLDGKETSAQNIYWKMKSVVSRMIIKCISKLLNNPGMNQLRFNSDDFINLMFKK